MIRFLLAAGLAAANSGFSPRPEARCGGRSCRDAWLEFWKAGFDQRRVERAVVDLGRGTGFRVSDDGLVLTSYHVALELCRIPDQGRVGAYAVCGLGTRLVSHPSWLEYVKGADVALLRRPRATAALELRAQPPLLLERVFLAGYPAPRAVRPEALPYPVGAPGRRLPWLRDPLMLGTGRLTATTADGLLWTDPSRYPGRLPDFAVEDGFADPDPAGVAGGPGMSGGPLLDREGRVLGIAFGDNRYVSAALAVKALRLCFPPKDRALERLAERLRAAGLCESST